MFSLNVDDEIELGLLEERHAQALYNLIEQNREYLGEWIPPISNMKTVEEVEKFIKDKLKNFSENNGF